MDILPACDLQKAMRTRIPCFSWFCRGGRRDFKKQKRKMKPCKNPAQQTVSARARGGSDPEKRKAPRSPKREKTARPPDGNGRNPCGLIKIQHQIPVTLFAASGALQVSLEGRENTQIDTEKSQKRRKTSNADGPTSGAAIRGISGHF